MGTKSTGFDDYFSTSTFFDEPFEIKTQTGKTQPFHHSRRRRRFFPLGAVSLPRLVRKALFYGGRVADPMSGMETRPTRLKKSPLKRAPTDILRFFVCGSGLYPRNYPLRGIP
jgi:hypothetical protein